MAVSGEQLVTLAKAKLGDQYVYGAEGPDTFDCSGLTQFVFGEAGIKIPRTSQEQWNYGTAVQENQLQAGDLVFTAGSDGTTAAPGHVGIYDGAGGVIHAPHTGTTVQVIPLDAFGATGYRRMPNSSGGGLSPNQLSAAGGDVTSAVGGLASISPLNPFSNGLFSIPGEITTAFKDIDSVFVDLYHEFVLFTQPSTWIRIGSGLFGALFLIVGLVLLLREVRNT